MTVDAASQRLHANAAVVLRFHTKHHRPVVGDFIRRMASHLEPDVQDPRRCSLCGKRSEDVRKLIGGPHGAICNECVLICYDILRRDGMVPPASNAQES